MAKFVQIQTCEQGHTHDELINIEDISRIALGPNLLFLRTPYGNGEHRHSITQKSVDKLLKVLDIVGEGEQMASELTQKQINELVAEYKKYYDGDEEVTEEKVLKELKEYIKDFTDYENIEEVPFNELLDFIG